MKKNILIIGATSAIAEAAARRFSAQGSSLYLLARNQERLESLANDLRVRGASNVGFSAFDANDYDQHKALIDAAVAALGGLDVVLVAHGSLSDQAVCEQDVGVLLKEFSTNCLSVLSLLTLLANTLEMQGHGTVAVISSVAGDRGRQSNYVYGTAKGALTIFLQGLRNRLAAKGVHVVTIKPGFVDTPMTAAFPKGALWAKPEKVAADIDHAIASKRDVVYSPWFWFFIMMIIRHIPEKIFKRLKL